ncbi:hypothetical protein BDW71DRAFT_211229 [Aspergillus fruticulosus]
MHGTPQPGQDADTNLAYTCSELVDSPTTFGSQFISFIPSCHFEAPRGGYAFIDETTSDTTNIGYTASPTAPTTGAGVRQTLRYAMLDNQQYLSPCASSNSPNYPGSGFLDLSPQEPAAVSPINNNDAPGPQRSTPKIPREIGSPLHTSAAARFQCKWQGCDSSHRFKRENDLIRHIRTIHISPDAWPCLMNNCGMAFGRKDHLIQHNKRRHNRAKA